LRAKFKPLAYPEPLYFLAAWHWSRQYSGGYPEYLLGMGWAKLRQGLSDFVVDEIQHTYRGMMIAIETCPLVCFFSHSR